LFRGFRLNAACATSLLALGLAGTTSAQAQDTAGPDQDATAEAQGGLEEIVVTARKVAENLQSVPVAVTAFSGEALQQQNAALIPDVARLTPGFVITPASSTPTAVSLQIRGQVQYDVLATLDPSVGTYIDGVYWARAYGLNSDLLDVQSVQVLRGPQGTLFGRNTTGGALLVQTNDPSFRGLSGRVSATYGRFNERTGNVVLNLPLIDDKLAVRGAFNITKRDGFVRNRVSGKKLGEIDNWTGRIKVLARPTENFSLLLSGEIFETDALTRPYQTTYVAGTSPANLEAAFETYGLGAPAVRLPQGVALYNDYINYTRGHDRVALNEDPRSYAKTRTFNATATLDTFFGAVKFIGSYRDVAANANVDLEGSPYNIVRTLGNQDLKQWSGELQITGKAMEDQIDFAAGVFAFDESGFDTSTSVALPIVSGANVFRQIYFGDITNRSMGMYGQATWHVTDVLSFTGGLRYSVEDKNIVSYNRTVDVNTGALKSCSITGSDPVTCRVGRKNDFDGVSYTAGINYQATPDVLIYAKSSKGFRSGGQNLRATGFADAAFVAFEPEIAHEQEIGLKSELFDRRVRFNIAAFYSRVNNIQRTTLTVSGNGAPTTTIGNAGKARFMGGEAELTAEPIDGFRLSANGALVDAKYLRYSDASGDRRAEPFQLVPKWTFSLAANYEHELSLGKLLLHADYSWQAKTYLDRYTVVPSGSAAQDAINAQIGKEVVRSAGGEANARVALTVLDDSLDLAVFGRNIFNRRANATALMFGAPINVVSVQRNNPATYGVTATYRFGQ